MKNGHELATLSTGTTSVTYNYNVDSVRIKKTVNGVVHEYVVDGYKILEEKYGNTVLKFTYDENDSPQSINYNGATYYYGKNLQGDIVKIYDANGNAIAGYTYDAWGNVISISYTNIYGMASANTNPFRYRGYYYDTESGLYYLNSRYYDAKVGRFVCSDYVLSPKTLGYNLYSYCENGFVNKYDPTGNDAIWLTQSTAAMSFGHTSIIVQDKKGDWYYFYWGPQNENFGLHVFCCPAYTELTKIKYRNILIDESKKYFDLYQFNSYIIRGYYRGQKYIGRPYSNDRISLYNSYIYKRRL